MDLLSEYTVPARAPQYTDAPGWVRQGPLAGALETVRNPDNPDAHLYTHQAKGIDLARQGQNIIISTGTASGKSLIFQLPALQKLHDQPHATALALYPLKALVRDQANRWRRMTEICGLRDQMPIGNIDGDRTTEERTNTLRRCRLLLTTPDMLHAYLLSYSDSSKPAQQSFRETKDAIRRFIASLQVIIIDEAHEYDEAFGAHAMWTYRRLIQRHYELSSGARLQIIAASATVRNPQEHLRNLTGKDFEVITEAENGAPRQEMTIRHAACENLQDDGRQTLEAEIRDAIARQQKYLAFIDSRQLVERVARNIENVPPYQFDEQTIIENAHDSMSYRSGLTERELIENQFRDNRISGIVSTSALEMGIDLPNIQRGMNLGMTESARKIKQRIGRIARNTPGEFTIIAEPSALDPYGGTAQSLWSHEVERANLYAHNEEVRLTHQVYLTKETDLNQNHNEMPSPGEPWPFHMQDEALTSLMVSGQPYDPDLEPYEFKRTSIRHISNTSVTIVAARPDGREKTVTAEQTKRTAMLEAYPLARYTHAKQTYIIEKWETSTDEHGNESIKIYATQGDERRTQRRTENHLTVRLDEMPADPKNFILYAEANCAQAGETITGCMLKGQGEEKDEEIIYAEAGIPEVTDEIATTATIIAIDEPWFVLPSSRERIANALLKANCVLLPCNEKNVRAQWDNIRIEAGGETHSLPAAIALWDRPSGGLGLTKGLADAPEEHARKVMEMSRLTAGRAETSGLAPTTATQLYHWLKNYTERPGVLVQERCNPS